MYKLTNTITDNEIKECCNNCIHIDKFKNGNQCLRSGNLIKWNITQEHNLSSCFNTKN